MHRAIKALLLFVVIALSADAGTGQLLTLPLPRQPVRSGILLTIDTRWISSNGYRPVRVKVSPIAGGVATADRYFEVKLLCRSQFGGAKANTAMGTVRLAQGAAFGEAVIDVPHSATWGMYDIETWEDGRYLQDLSTKRYYASNRVYYEQRDTTPSILILNRAAPDWNSGTRSGMGTIPNATMTMQPGVVPIAGGVSAVPFLRPSTAAPNSLVMGQELNLLPDVRVFASRFPLNYYYGGAINMDRLTAQTPISDPETIRLIGDITWLDLLPPSALPDRWLSYSGVDVVIASLADLEYVASQFSEKWESIRTWLTTGTTLCVHGVGEDFSELPRLAKLLDLPAESASPSDLHPGWSTPEEKQLNREIQALSSANGSATMIRQQATFSNPNQKPEKESASKISWDKTPFIYRSVGRSRVVAIADENPFPGTEELWGSIFNTVPSRNWLWYQRNGVSNQAENEQYWNLLIPDIGRAPILSFLALITLFAVVVGPVNYFVLHRRRRLNWLLVTVPVGALVVTISLFSYAMIADGLGVRARIRSFTEIDQKLQRSTSWSRQTYYAGLAPSQGLVFPTESAVYPIDHRPVSTFSVQDRSRVVSWTKVQQWTGFLTSRTMAQMLVVEPRHTSAGLKVTEPTGDELPRAVNELGVSINSLLVCDSRGQFFTAADLRPGDSVELQVADLGNESSVWRTRLGANRPNYPEGFNPAQLENVSGIFGISNRTMESGLAPPTFDSSLMESGIRDAMAGDFRGMAPRSYVALTPRPPLVSLGVEGADEVSGFHLIVGSW